MKKLISKKISKKIGALIILVNIFALNILTAKAALLDGITCINDGKCELNDFIKLFVNGSKIILGLSGSAALLFFIAGGIMFLTSAGSQERVTRGKSMLSGAALGLVIVFLSYMIIGFVLKTLGVEGAWFKTGFVPG